MFTFTHPIKSIKRSTNMGLYNKLSKIEQLIETNTKISYWAWTEGWISVEQLPDKMRDCMIQFGYKKEAPLFGVHVRSPGSDEGKVYDLIYISPGKDDNAKWTDLLYKDVDRNWRYTIMFNHNSNLTDELKKENDDKLDKCYDTLSKLFAFLNIYMRHREELVQLVNNEYDQL